MWNSDRIWDWLRLLWAHPLPFLTATLAGAAFSFTYSYVPLHANKMWKIEYLEKRVDQQNLRLQGLQQELARASADAADRPERGEFEALRAELAQAQHELGSYRAKEKRSQRTIKVLRKARDEWKSKHAELLAERAAQLAADPGSDLEPSAADPSTAAAGAAKMAEASPPIDATDSLAGTQADGSAGEAESAPASPSE